MEKLRNTGHACGGICTIILGVFILYSAITYFIKISVRETLFSEKLYLANEQDRNIKFDTLTN